MQRLVDAGLVSEDWKDNETNGIATSSVVTFVVREGNPEGIETWDDLVQPGVEIITPNPASSGSAKWNILAAWAHVVGAGGSEAEAEKFVTAFLENTIALPPSAREATTAFSEGNGDVLISYENEAILARQNGEPFDYIVPDDTLLIENPAAVLTDAADVRPGVPRVPHHPGGAGRLRPVRLPPGRRRRRAARGRGCARPGSPFPEPGPSTRSTATSTAGPRPT